MNYTTMELDSRVIAAAELFTDLRESHLKDNNVSIGLDLFELIELITFNKTDLNTLIETSAQRTIGMANIIFTTNDEKEIMDAHIRSTFYEIARFIASTYKNSKGFFSIGAKSNFKSIKKNKVNVITMGSGIFFEINGEKFVSHATKTMDANKI